MVQSIVYTLALDDGERQVVGHLTRLTRIAVTVGGAVLGTVASAQFVPPAGYSGKVTAPGVAITAKPGAPRLTRLPDAGLSGWFRIDPAYPRIRHASIRVVGACAIAERAGARLAAAWGAGFLPVTLAFEDGRCFAFAADYVGETLSNGRLNRTNCDHPKVEDGIAAPALADGSLRSIGSAWGYGAWVDDRTGTTIVGAPGGKTSTPLFTARFPAGAIMAMNSPDAPLGT